jgi:cell division protein FtsB
MNRLFQQRYVIRQNLILLIGICLSVYFSYHLLQGNRSYLRLMSLNSNIIKLSAEYETLKTDRQEIESKVVMLRPGSINKDLLEERARAILGWQHPDEKTIIVN